MSVYDLEYKLVSILVRRRVNEINPTLDKAQIVRYPIVEEALGIPGPEVDAVLMELFKHGAIERRLYSRVIVCPSCNIIDPLLIFLLCPNCDSADIIKKTFIKHKCGFEGPEERIILKEKCPKCNTGYVKGSFIKIMRFYCNYCGKYFKRPKLFYVCRNCLKTSSIEETSFIDIYSYKVSTLSFKKINLILKIEDLLKSLGYEVNTPYYMNGVSGLKHKFDIHGYRKNNSHRLLINIHISDKLLDEAAIINSFAIDFDIYPLRTTLIAIPGLSESSKQLLSIFKVNVIEAKDIETALKNLSQHILAEHS